MAAFYLDEDTPESLAQTLLDYGHTVATTTSANRKGAKDYEQLWFAAAQGAIFADVEPEGLHAAARRMEALGC
ncbi:MAG: DUF5615 family PIN-like protein [Chloroflexota bacterium]|nr:DUF5615 family PIN-like protein [Chloroflexota bacterium]